MFFLSNDRGDDMIPSQFDLLMGSDTIGTKIVFTVSTKGAGIFTFAILKVFDS